MVWTSLYSRFWASKTLTTRLRRALLEYPHTTPGARNGIARTIAASMQERTRCPKEPHAQRSWHLQRSPPCSAVGGSATKSVVAELSPTRSGSSTPRDRACSSTRDTQGARAHPPIPLDPRTVTVSHHLRADASYRILQFNEPL